MLSKRFPALCLFVVVFAFPAAAEEWGIDANVLVTFEVGTQESGKEVVLKTYEMMVGADGKPASMSTGARIPIPTTSFNVQEASSNVAKPMVTFTYQQVGFKAEVSAKIDEDGKILLRGHVEDSSLTGHPSAEEGRPFIQSMEQNVTAKLEPGKPLRINRVDETDVRTFFIRVQADPMPAGVGQMAAKRKR